MKTVSRLPICMILLVIIISASCNRKENTAPTQDQTRSAKEAAELVDVRAEYELLSQYPLFTGGDSLFLEYLKAQVKYPQEARDNHISGRVFASFIVETDGSISNPEILRGIGYGCDESVIQALTNMPAWVPGKIENHFVRVKLVIPIEFRNES